MIYPVGSIYITSETSFNPSEKFGGTWEQIEGRFLLGAGDPTKKFQNNGTYGKDTNYDSSVDAFSVGSRGGTIRQNLTVSQMPSHTHSVNDPGHYHLTGLGNAGHTSENIVGPDIVGVQEKAAFNTGTSKSATGVWLSNTGSGTAIPNMPPFEVVIIWERTA